MHTEIDLTVVALLASIVAAVFAALTFRRAGDWRRSDAGKETQATLREHGDRLIKLETKVIDLATKADIATVTAELDAVQDEVRLARQGITRIEDFLLKRSK